MKSIKIISALLALAVITCACAAPDGKYKKSSITSPTSSYDDCADQLYVASNLEEEFIILRVKDKYMNASGNREEVYLGEDGEYPDIRDGEFARVKANVDCYDGGEAGFLGNYFINELESYEVIDYKTAFEDCDITSIDDDTFANRKFFLSYEINDNLYLLANIYNNGKYIERSPKSAIRCATK